MAFLLPVHHHRRDVVGAACLEGRAPRSSPRVEGLSDKPTFSRASSSGSYNQITAQQVRRPAASKVRTSAFAWPSRPSARVIWFLNWRLPRGPAGPATCVSAHTGWSTVSCVTAPSAQPVRAAVHRSAPPTRARRGRRSHHRRAICEGRPLFCRKSRGAPRPSRRPAGSPRTSGCGLPSPARCRAGRSGCGRRTARAWWWWSLEQSLSRPRSRQARRAHRERAPSGEQSSIASSLFERRPTRGDACAGGVHARAAGARRGPRQLTRRHPLPVPGLRDDSKRGLRWRAGRYGSVPMINAPPPSPLLCLSSLAFCRLA